MKKVLMTGITSVAVIISLVISAGNSLQAQEENREETGDFLPVRTVPPAYPGFAVTRGIEGWVQVQFNVYGTGEVVAAEVIDGCAYSQGGEGVCVDEWAGLFDENSIAAVNQFRFEPRVEDGRTVTTEGVQYVFRYELSAE